MYPALEARIVEVVKSGAIYVPPMPAAALQLMELLRSSDYSQGDVLTVVKSDQSLASAALRLANTPIYYRGTPVTQVARAVQCLGAAELQRIAISLTLKQAAMAKGPLMSLRRRAWREGVLSGHLCQRLAQLRGEDAEVAFTVGLLHDVGRLVALSTLERVLASDEDVPSLFEPEWWQIVERFHVELGMVLAASWRLPETIERVIADHHDHEAVDSELMRMVQACDEVVSLMEHGPHLSDSELVAIAELSAAERAALATFAPELVALLLAYDDDAVGDDGESLVSHPEVTFVSEEGEHAELGTNGQNFSVTLLSADARSVTVSCPVALRENALVTVCFASTPEVEAVAKVVSCQRTPNGVQARLALFALSAQQECAYREYLQVRRAAMQQGQVACAS